MTWIQALEYKANVIVGLFAVCSGILIEYILWDNIYFIKKVNVINEIVQNVINS